MAASDVRVEDVSGNMIVLQAGGDMTGDVVAGNKTAITIYLSTRPIQPEPQPVAVDIGPNPYKGLTAFYEEDADRFFGRERLIQELWEKFRRLHESSAIPLSGGARDGSPVPEEAMGRLRLLAILGPSGSGKSSVVRAGLLPELARRPLPGRQRARVAVLTPGSHPIRALSKILARIATNDPTPAAKTREFESELTLHNERDEWDGLSRIADILPDIEASPLIIVIDQFEEVYSLCQEREACPQFINNLLYAAADPAGHVSVILTLRSDFFGQTQSHQPLNHAIAAHSVIVPVMNDAELRQAIAKPAELASHPLDDTATVDLLILQSGNHEGALPLLQFALTRIWEGLAEGVAPAATLQKIGGVGGALAGEAQRLYDQLSDADKAIARRAFLRLVQLGGEGMQDTRRRITLQEIVAQGEDPQHVEDVLRVFAQPGARLVTLSADVERGEAAEVTHEALFTHWTTFKEWLEGNREDIRFHRRLAEAANHWAEQTRPDGLLWRSPDLELLEQFQSKTGSDMTPLQVEFWQAGKALQEREHVEKEAQRRRELETAQKLAAEAEARQIAETQARWEAEQRANEQTQSARRLRWLAIGLTLVFLAAVSMAWYAWQKQNEAKQVQHRRAINLFESYLTHAMLQAKVEDYAAARAILNQSRALDAEIRPERRHVRNLLAWFADLMGGTATQRYEGAGAKLFDVAISSDGKLIAAVGEKGTVVLFDAASGKLLKRLESHTGNVIGVIFHPAGKWLVTAERDRHIIFWTLPDGRKMREWQAPDKVCAIALNPDGNLLASGGDDRNVTIWDIETGKVLHTLTGHADVVNGLAFDHDSRLLASASSDNTARIWDLTTSEMLHILRGHTNYVDRIVFHPDGKILATGSGDKSIRLWDTRTGQSIDEFQAHKNAVTGLVFIDSGNYLVSASQDRTLRIWDIASGVTLKVLQGHTAGVLGIAANSQTLFSAGNDGILCRWKIGAQQPQNFTQIALPGEPLSVALTPDGAGVAVGFADGSLSFYEIGTANTLEASTALRQIWAKTGAHADGILRLAFSPDKKHLVSVSADQTAKLWQVNDGSLLQTFNDHRAEIIAVAFTPDGQSIATASFDGKIGRFEIGQKNGQFYPAHIRGVNSVAFDANGARLVSTGGDDLIRLWEGKDMQPLQSWQPPQFENSGICAIFSPNGDRIVSVGRDNLVHVLDANSGSEEQTLVGHESTIFRAAFSRDGGQVATVSADATVRLWDLTAGAELFTLHLPAKSRWPVPLWDFDFRCASRDCWIAIPLTRGQLAIYHLTEIYYE